MRCAILSVDRRARRWRTDRPCFPVVLPYTAQRAGYDTYLIGKLLNGFTEDTVSVGCPRGWTHLGGLRPGAGSGGRSWVDLPWGCCTPDREIIGVG